MTIRVPLADLAARRALDSSVDLLAFHDPDLGAETVAEILRRHIDAEIKAARKEPAR